MIIFMKNEVQLKVDLYVRIDQEVTQGIVEKLQAFAKLDNTFLYSLVTRARKLVCPLKDTHNEHIISLWLSIIWNPYARNSAI